MQELHANQLHRNCIISICQAWLPVKKCMLQEGVGVGGEGLGGHTIVAHGGQQRGQGPRLSVHNRRCQRGMTDRQTHTHTIRPLYDDLNNEVAKIGVFGEEQ